MATVGPASETRATLLALIVAGVDVVRLNLSHGDVADHLQRLADVRAVAEKVGKPVAVLADLPGPKIRSGGFPDGGVPLMSGDTVKLIAGDGPSDGHTIQVDYDHLLADLRHGCSVSLGDGAISFRVDRITDDFAEATVVSGGHATGSPGVHLPSDTVRLTTPTEEDLVLAEKMAAAGVEFIAVSFVRRADDVRRVAEVVAGRAQLVAKIETAAALDDLDTILDTTDAVMVARGDLGIDCPIEDVPHLQKRIIR
ncbi:MAG: pyruvate kinase, partial [Actinomycetota bacterium]